MNKKRATKTAEDYGPAPRRPTTGEAIDECLRSGLCGFTEIRLFSRLPAAHEVPATLRWRAGDEDGDDVERERKFGFLAEGPTIRLLIAPDADLTAVLRLLKKIRTAIKHVPAYLRWPKPPPSPKPPLGTEDDFPF
jgi:hypothetical protein